MRPTTPLSGWFKSFTNGHLHTDSHKGDGFIVRSIVLKTAPLGDRAKIILGYYGTSQSFTHADAPRGKDSTTQWWFGEQ